MGVEEGCGQGCGLLYELVECIHAPYCQLLVRYPAMETHLLKHKLHNIDMVSEWVWC